MDDCRIRSGTKNADSCLFLGIAVRMFFNDHEPPHFHARYQGYSARIRIADGTLIDGRPPPTVARLLEKNGQCCVAMPWCVTGMQREAIALWTDRRS